MPVTMLADGARRGGVEILLFLRDRPVLIGTLALPMVLLLLFGAIFRQASHAHAVGMMVFGVVTTTFVTVAAGVAADRADGTLRRLRGTPISATSYLTGKLVLVVALAAAEVALLAATGVLAFGMPVPDAAHWLTFLWVFPISVTVCALLGTAAGVVVRPGRRVRVILTAPVVALQVVSGVFVSPPDRIPSWLQQATAVLPVKWMAQGMRSVFLPDGMREFEAAGRWEPVRTALVLGAWCVIGLLLCLVTFRWTAREP